MIKIAELINERSVKKLRHQAKFIINKVWDFLESKPFGGSHEVDASHTAHHIFKHFTKSEMKKYIAFEWNGKERPLHPRERFALSLKQGDFAWAEQIDKICAALLREGVDFNQYKSQLENLNKYLKSQQKKSDTERKIAEYEGEGYFKRAFEMGMQEKFISNLTRKRVNKILRKASLEHAKLDVIIEAIDFILNNLETV